MSGPFDGDRTHALASDGGALTCPACGWRVRALAPEIESEGLTCPTCGELIYSGRELGEWPTGDGRPAAGALADVPGDVANAVR